MSPQEHDIMRAVEDHYWWYRALREEVTKTIAPSRDDFVLLDAGCGTGGMLTAVRAKFPGAKLAGIDVSQHALDLATAREIGAELCCGSVSELPWPNESFDCVLSLDVLTHAGIDESETLREARRVLRPNGKLILNLAAFDFLKGAHDVAVEVDRRYTRRELSDKLRAENFQIERATYWNALLLPPIALARWISRAKSPSPNARSDFRPLPRSINTALRQLALLEFSVSRQLSLPFGTSLFAVAKKNG